MQTRLVVALVLGAGLASAPASAQESFSLQVTLPPLGAAQSAQDAGAVGSWTVLSPSGGLMIAGGEDKLTIYRSDANRFNLLTPLGSLLPPTAKTESGGLTALTFGPSEGGKFILSAL